MTATLLTIIGFVFYIGMFAVGAWILTRMNLQVRRMKESPTPKESLVVLIDLVEASDLKLNKVQRDLMSNEAALEDLNVRLKSVVNRTNAEARKNDKLDTVALADYLQGQPQSEAPAAPETLPTVDQNTGQAIDYR